MKIDHIALYVQDLDGAKNFFETFFAGKSNEMYHNPKTGLRTYFITFPEGGRIEIMNRPNVEYQPFSQYRSGFIHLAVSVGTREAVDALTARLAENGYVTLSGPRLTGDGCYESCVCGFEGNLIEITE